MKVLTGLYPRIIFRRWPGDVPNKDEFCRRREMLCSDLTDRRDYQTLISSLILSLLTCMLDIYKHDRTKKWSYEEDMIDIETLPLSGQTMQMHEHWNIS